MAREWRRRKPHRGWWPFLLMLIVFLFIVLLNELEALWYRLMDWLGR